MASSSGEPYLDYRFPLDQFGGANVGSGGDAYAAASAGDARRDAENYLARLEQVGDRMDEAVAEGERLAAKNMIPPRFILRGDARLDAHLQRPRPPSRIRWRAPFARTVASDQRDDAGASATALRAQAATHRGGRGVSGLDARDRTARVAAAEGDRRCGTVALQGRRRCVCVCARSASRRRSSDRRGDPRRSGCSRSRASKARWTRS